MKELKDLIVFLYTQSNPVIILLVLAIITPYLLKIYKEIGSLSYSIKEKKLDILLSYVNDGIDKKHKLAVEQVFFQNFGVLMGYKEIEYLMKFDAPSIALIDYKWARQYLEYDTDSSTMKYRKNYNLKVREYVLQGLYLLFILSALLSFMVLAAYIIQDAFSSNTINSFLLFCATCFMTWFSLRDARSLYAAKRIINEQKSHNKKFNMDSGADAPPPVN